MQPASLEKLLQKLAPSLLKSTPHNGTFGVEFVKPETVMMALRWLAGGNYGDIRLVAGCSVMSLFRLLWQVMFAIIANMSDFRRMLGVTSSLALLQKPEFPMCTKTVFCVDEYLFRDPDLKITCAYIEPMPLPKPCARKRVSPFRSIHKTNCCDDYSWSQLEKMDDCPHSAVNNILRPSYNIARKK